MHRWLFVVLSVALAVLVFAPVAAAHGDDDGGYDDKRTHARRADDRGFDDRGWTTGASMIKGCIPGEPIIWASMIGGWSTVE